MPDLTLAVSEGTFATTIDLLKRNFKIKKYDFFDFGRFRAEYHLRAHLEGGTTDIRPDGSVQLSELDLRWDEIRFSLAMAIDEVCVGGGCINLGPLGTICTPRICAFEDAFDVEIEIDLAPFVAQEVSLEATLSVRHWDPTSPPAFTGVCDPLRDVLAFLTPFEPFPMDRNQWHIHLIPGPVDLDLFDFPDIAGNLFEDTLTAAITAVIPGGGAVRNLILAIIGGIADLIRTILDIPDEIEEWLSDLFNISFGLRDFLIQIIGLYFGSCIPIYRIDDPFTILPRQDGLIPVKVPIRNLAVSANDDELIITADVGA